MSLSVQRDSFARGEYVRECLTNTTSQCSCKWCGNTPKRLYSYTWVADDVSWQVWRSGEYFCKWQCYRSFYL